LGRGKSVKAQLGPHEAVIVCKYLRRLAVLVLSSSEIEGANIKEQPPKATSLVSRDALIPIWDFAPRI